MVEPLVTLPVAGPPALRPVDPPAPEPALLTTMRRRRSIKRLRPGPLSDATLARICESVRLTPAAFNRTPWHVVIVHERLPSFWDLVERAIYDRLEGERQERYLQRLTGFRGGVAAILIYEDLAAREALTATGIDAEQARSFVEQGLGMVQLALWLAVTAEGLSTSLQHWEWLIEDRLAAFLNLPPARYRLVATLPVGYAGEHPAPVARPGIEHVISRDRFSGEEAAPR